jgi:hypothetical protein
LLLDCCSATLLLNRASACAPWCFVKGSALIPAAANTPTAATFNLKFTFNNGTATDKVVAPTNWNLVVLSQDASHILVAATAGTTA